MNILLRGVFMGSQTNKKYGYAVFSIVLIKKHHILDFDYASPNTVQLQGISAYLR
jgi:hypothetical protein